jgi:hypothetical protein
MSYWLGCDPGGKNKFGVVRLSSRGSFSASTLASVDDVLQTIDCEPLEVGIDCPLWWITCEGGGRKADRWIRENYGLSGGEVQSVNRLRGAAVVQGILLAMKLREQYPSVRITEAHPKALIKAIKMTGSDVFKLHFELSGQLSSEHERDALVAAVAAREGFSNRWDVDLSLKLSQSELDPKNLWFGAVNYWWPNTAKLR